MAQPIPPTYQDIGSLTVQSKVFFDIQSNGQPYSRVEIGLFDQIAPQNVQNFIKLLPSYVNTQIFEVQKQFYIRGGDPTNIGSGGHAYDQLYLDDENLTLRCAPTAICMVNSGPNTNNSQFFILTEEASWLNGKTQVIGKVTAGYAETVKEISCLETDAFGKTIDQVTIVGAGLL